METDIPFRALMDKDRRGGYSVRKLKEGRTVGNCPGGEKGSGAT